jgi:hypothetical protein
VETAMFRMKTSFSGRLKNRLIENQRAEARITCKILNHFTKLGLPEIFNKKSIGNNAKYMSRPFRETL